MNDIHSDLAPEIKKKRKLAPGVRAAVNAIMSLFVSGLGHVSSGSVGKGLALFLGEYLLFASIVMTSVLFSKWGLFGALVLILCYKSFVVIDSARIELKQKDDKAGGLPPMMIYALCVGLVLVSQIVRPTLYSRAQAFRIAGPAMTPSLLVGDMVLVDKQSYSEETPVRGDLVLFLYPRDPKLVFVKRCVAIGGDLVEIVDKKLLVNGEQAPQYGALFLDPNMEQNRDNFGPLTIPEGEIFALGDNRDNSNDSRFWGTVKEEAVFAKAKIIYWSWDKSSHSIRWNRLGKELE